MSNPLLPSNYIEAGRIIIELFGPDNPTEEQEKELHSAEDAVVEFLEETVEAKLPKWIHFNIHSTA